MQPLESALYRGVVRHRRRSPRTHEFNYQTWMIYLDLDEVDRVMQTSRMLSRERFNLASYRRSDYLGPADIDLKSAVLDLCERRTGRRPSGPVRMLSHLRHLGYSFSPVTFYYVYEGGRLDIVIAEITNTPWGERHQYVMPVTEHGDHPDPGSDSRWRFRFGKDFHVSPFMPMDLDYDWRFSTPAERLTVSMRLLREGKDIFHASLDVNRIALTNRSVRRLIVHQPAITIKVLVAIYWEAFKLWTKRVPFHEHPGASA